MIEKSIPTPRFIASREVLPKAKELEQYDPGPKAKKEPVDIEIANGAISATRHGDEKTDSQAPQFGQDDSFKS